MGLLVRDPQDLEYSIIKAELSDLIPAGSKPDLLEVTGGAVLGADSRPPPNRVVNYWTMYNFDSSPPN